MPTVKQQRRYFRHRRIRAKVFGTADRPRVSVFKSNTRLYAQLIDDRRGYTLAAVSSAALDGQSGVDKAYAAGAELASQAKKQGVEKVAFDRGGYVYTGQVRALADGLRSESITV